MAEIVPAVLAEDTKKYAHDLERALSLTSRIQIDLADGKFAPNRTVSLGQLYWPESTRADLHLMYENPLEQLPSIIALNPHLIIFHAEALNCESQELHDALKELRELGIKVGLALLAPTPVSVIEPVIGELDHVLIFTGDLGHYGGKLNPDLLKKAEQIRTLRPQLEIGIDGGVNDTNAAMVVEAGIDVLNVGGYLQQAENPKAAYATLQTVLSQ